MAPLQGDAVTNGTALANLLKPVMGTNCSFTGIDYAPEGSDIFNPAATLSIAGTGSFTVPATSTPYQISFTARSGSGRKTRLFVFGTNASIDTNWRIEQSESTAFGAIMSGLASGVGGITCIDGSVPIWHAYANVGANDHWVKKVRQGAG